MPQQHNKKQTFLQGAIILLVANMMVKVIGALFKIPLQWMLGDEGMGIFSVAYQFYTAMFVISTAGVPVALSKMVSESAALGRNKEFAPLSAFPVWYLSPWAPSVRRFCSLAPTGLAM